MWKRAKRGIWKDLGEGKRREKWNYNIKIFKYKKNIGEDKSSSQPHPQQRASLVYSSLLSVASLQNNAFKTGLGIYEQKSLRFSVSALNKADSRQWLDLQRS